MYDEALVTTDIMPLRDRREKLIMRTFLREEHLPCKTQRYDLLQEQVVSGYDL